MEHEEYHEQTIQLLQASADLLSQIAIMSNAMLSVFVVASVAIIWMLIKR